MKKLEGTLVNTEITFPTPSFDMHIELQLQKNFHAPWSTKRDILQKVT